MAHTPEHRTQSVPEFWAGADSEHRRKMALAINGLLQGRLNSHFTVTLTPDATETELRYTDSRPGVTMLLTPNSPTAAASQAAGTIWVETQTGKAIIHHDASPATDRRFFAVFIG